MEEEEEEGGLKSEDLALVDKVMDTIEIDDEGLVDIEKVPTMLFIIVIYRIRSSDLKSSLLTISLIFGLSNNNICFQGEGNYLSLFW